MQFQPLDAGYSQPDGGSENEQPGNESDYDNSEDDAFEEEALRRAGSPVAIRGKILKFLQTTDVKIGEFQNILGVNSNSYNRFVNSKYKNPWSAAENQTYRAAARFFLREKKLGSKAMGVMRKIKKDPNTGKSSKLSALEMPNISGVLTDGFTYLTPEETRRQLRVLLKLYQTSNAALAKLANVPYQSFNLFLKATGEFGGGKNQVYHPAAQLVEKIRIARGQPKSQKRLGIEAEIRAGRTNFDGSPFLGMDPNSKVLCMKGTCPVMARDSLGRRTVRFVDVPSAC